MRDVMLFGEGWNGEVRQVEDGVQRYNYIPQIGDPHLREIVFSIFLYEAINKNSYWIGYTGYKPFNPDIEGAILNFAPKPYL